jgi:hypothetical protein
MILPADVTGGKPIATLQSVSVVNTIKSDFYDIMDLGISNNKSKKKLYIRRYRAGMIT